jgi:hypothetical protein
MGTLSVTLWVVSGQATIAIYIVRALHCYRHLRPRAVLNCVRYGTGASVLAGATAAAWPPAIMR